ncbi:lytic transglycosylase domain-containing protein [Desulfospira joergensenii]|uniref:lytic transglycosylase domain-containing protein n=1 Tax=Desulfospira joergensenii TaxID=53329 RepID=UPI0003B4F074|nr:lytic transglycosylase domain-containing protein [Desulfospira joergensenii]
MKLYKSPAWSVLCLFFVLAALLPGVARANFLVYIDQNGINFALLETDSPIKIKAVPIQKQEKKEPVEAIIKRCENRHGIEAALIKAVIRVESGFNAQAVSKKGAKGLMQIMPGNFRALGISDPFNPEENIMGGARLLKELSVKYDYELPLVLAAYNAGTKAVKKYGRQIPPFPETREYIRKVLTLYKQYKEKV